MCIIKLSVGSSARIALAVFVSFVKYEWISLFFRNVFEAK